MPESSISCLSDRFFVIFFLENHYFLSFSGFGSELGSKSLHRSIWDAKNTKTSPIWKPKINMCCFILRWYFEHGFKIFFGRHLDHFGDPIGRLLMTFWDHLSNVNAREGFSDFWYLPEAFCLFLWVWVVGNSSHNHIKTKQNHDRHLLRLEVIF